MWHNNLIDRVIFRLQQASTLLYERFRAFRFHLVESPLYKLKTPLFEHINIQTNNICTRKCDFCYFGVVKKIDPVFISKKLFRKIILELVEFNFEGRVSLYEINEPLTDPRIFDFLEYTRFHLPDAFLFLSTNGDLLTRDKGLKLFESGLDLLHINTYAEKDIRKNKMLAKHLNNQGCSVKHYPKVYNEKWSSRAGNIAKYAKRPIGVPCELVYKQIIVKPDGTVCSCVNDLFNINIIGNARENTIFDIWFSQTFEELRSQLRKGNRNISRLCANCDYIGYGDYFIKKNKKK